MSPEEKCWNNGGHRCNQASIKLILKSNHQLIVWADNCFLLLLLLEQQNVTCVFLALDHSIREINY